MPFFARLAHKAPKSVFDILLAEKIGILSSFVSEIARMMWGRIEQSFESDISGAVFSVVSFTDGMSNPAMRRRNDRSKMAQKSLELWGIIDIGDTFKFLGGLLLYHPIAR